MNRENNVEDQINRYMYQVSRYLFCKNKEDIEKEIRSIIDDMLAARCKDAEPTREDVTAVFTEIGKPRDLAIQYVDSKNYLIGPLLYPIYLRVLKIDLIVSLIAVLVFNFISLVSGTYTQDTFGTIFDVALSAFATVTIVFAIIERKGVNTDKLLSSEFALPPVPKRKNRIPVSSPIVSIIFGFIFISLFAFSPEVFGVVTPKTNGIIPVFDLDVIRSILPFIILFFCVGMVKSVFEWMEGRYTVRLLIQTAICNVISGMIVFYILTRFSIWNPNFSEKFMKTLENPDIHVYLFGNEQTVSSTLLAVIIFALLLDTFVCAVKVIWKDK